MTKRATKTPKSNTVSAATVGALTSRILKDAEAGKRTIITRYNIVVAAVVSADDLKTLEAVK